MERRRAAGVPDSVDSCSASRHIDRSFDEIQRPMFRLDINASDVFADRSKTDQHHAEIRQQQQVNRRQPGHRRTEAIAWPNNSPPRQPLLRA